MTDSLLLGLDIGASVSRALVADADGRRLGEGRAAGGNPSGRPVDQALSAIADALRAALSGVDPRQVRGAVVGLAGVGRLQEPDVAERFARMWRSVGLTCPCGLVADAAVAFAAGSPASAGTLLLAGTGATAAEIAERRPRTVADAHGWLLGDLGSGFWVGREAVRAVLACLEGRAPETPLARRVLAELLGAEHVTPGRDAVNSVINAVRRDAPVDLARFARTVSNAAENGDPVACDIVARAAGHLIDTASLVRPDTASADPLVLAGGMLINDGPVSAAVRDAVARRWPSAPVSVARDGAAGAAWLAALEHADLTCSAEELHARLLPEPN